jgi:RNA polymerase sigma factor (TIGR02999 family)
MTQSDQQTVTRLLAELQSGRHEAFDELFPLVYGELRRLAHRQRRRWEGDDTLNTTALVHEAYLKLVAQTTVSWETEAHFLAAASRAIRHILINYARDRRAQKRGGTRQRVSLERLHRPAEAGSLVGGGPEWLMALDTALQKLSSLSERQSRIIECRFFGGMTVKQTAAALGISTASVTRGWSMAQAWLYRELEGGRNGAEV